MLVAARTLTSTIRVLEVVDLFRGDFRVRFRFAVNDTTQFGAGVRALLDEAGVDEVIPWSDLGTESYQLVLSASENLDFGDLHAHTIVLPHGLGFHKYVPTASGEMRLAGLPPKDVIQSGRVTIVLSHPVQREQLRSTCPGSEAHTAVTGDLTLERLLASMPLRQRYRARLGTGDRTLVLIASTWRPSSVVGRDASLPSRLVAELPVDEYQVCVVLHPNIWARYGRVQIRLWLAAALDAGLVLLPPENGWQSALIAADQIISDHGSLGLMAAKIDRPVLLTGDSDEIVPNTPVARLVAQAPWLDPRLALREQLETCRDTYQAGQYHSITDHVFAHQGEAATRLRNLIYRRLSLSPPAEPAPLLRIADLPRDTARPVSSLAVRSAALQDGRLRLIRYPAATWPPDMPVNVHLACVESTPDIRLRERAAIILADSTDRTEDEAMQWTDAALTHHPGARVAAARSKTRCVVTIRDGTRVLVASRPTSDLAASASAVYCCLLSGNLVNQELAVLVGSATLTLTLVLDPPADSSGC